MRVFRSTAAAVLLAACGEEDAVVRIEDFRARSPLVVCEPVAGGAELVSGNPRFHPHTDSSFIAVDEDGRQIWILDDEARPLHRLEFPTEGPGSIVGLADAIAFGDSLVVVADDGRNRLVGIALTGEERWSVDLGFPPQGVTRAGDRLLVAAVGMDVRIPALIFEVEQDRVTPLEVPFVPNADALARMFSNSVVLFGLEDGSAIAVGELVWPHGWLIPASGSPTRFAVPIPDETADRAGYMPPMPIREEDLKDIVAPVVGIAYDESTTDYFYLTRSGLEADEYMEKAIVRATSRFDYLGSVRLPVNAAEIAWLPARGETLLAIDSDLAWHRCPVPARDA